MRSGFYNAWQRVHTLQRWLLELIRWANLKWYGALINTFQSLFIGLRESWGTERSLLSSFIERHLASKFWDTECLGDLIEDLNELSHLASDFKLNCHLNLTEVLDWSLWCDGSYINKFTDPVHRNQVHVVWTMDTNYVLQLLRFAVTTTYIYLFRVFACKSFYCVGV